MIVDNSGEHVKNVCNIRYLTEMMDGKKNLIRGVMEAFLKQVSEELQGMNDAILKIDYAGIKNIAHSMKSSVSIMDIPTLLPILKELEELGATATNIEKIKELNQRLNTIGRQSMEEIEREKRNYA